MSDPELHEWLTEFVPLNRRRLSGDPPLSALELQRWGELRDLLSWKFGQKPPVPGSPGRPLRIPAQLKIRYGAQGENSAHLDNLSEGGLFITIESPLPPETPLQLELDPGDGSPLMDLEAVVAWTRELANLDGPAGMGVAFRNLQADDLPGLARLIERALEDAANRD